jgi:hypothetical protein
MAATNADSTNCFFVILIAHFTGKNDAPYRRISSILRTTVHASQEMSATLTRSSAKLVKIPDNPETTPKPQQTDAATLKTR